MPRLHASATPWWRWRCDAGGRRPLAQPALDDGCRPFQDRRAAPRKLPLRSGGFIQLDQLLATHGPDRVTAVGDDHHIGGEAGQAERPGSRQRNGKPRVRQPGANLDEDAGMSARPQRVVRAIVKREAMRPQQTMRIADCPHTCLSRANEKRRPKPPAWIEPVPLLQQAGFRKGEQGTLADDDVVQYPHIDERQRGLALLGQACDPRWTARNARRMLVGEKPRRHSTPAHAARRHADRPRSR